MSLAAPDLAAFLAAPIEAVRAVAPRSVALAPGGTRRAAALAGVDPRSDGYALSQREGLLSCIELAFAHGAEHVFMTPITAFNRQEYAQSWERFVGWVDWGIAGEETLAFYRERGWRVRLLGADDLPELAPTAERISAASARASGPTLWWSVLADPDTPWRAVFAAARSGAASRAEVARALYGEDVPLITMLLSFGKPLISTDLLPPLLIGDVQCYWTQRPGYTMTAAMVRRIIYDYAYLRTTRHGRDQRDRYAEVGAQRELWSTEAIVGEGKRVGGFWFPAAFPDL